MHWEGREDVTRALKAQIKPPFRKRDMDKYSIFQIEHILRRGKRG